MSEIKSAREVGFRARAKVETEATQHRSMHLPTRPRTARDEAKLTKVDSNGAVVRGRYLNERIVWDVFTIQGRKLVLTHSGCAFREEALALASDAILGRVSISLSGMRSVFPSKTDAVAAPIDNDLVLPGHRPMNVRKVNDLEYVVTGKPTTTKR